MEMPVEYKKWNRVVLFILILGFISIPKGFGINISEPLEGVVLDAHTGDPIPGATVEIAGLDRGTATDSDGTFQFPDMSEGEYTLTLRFVGYTKEKLTVNHPADGYLTIKMEVKLFRSDEVVVTGSPLGKSIQYQPAQALTTEMLQRKSAPSLGEILEGNPGVSARSFGSAPSRPVIRGLGGDRVLVLQNGERMGDLSGTAVDHAVALDPLSMDRVEIVRGPASLLYGSSAIGGVVNLFSNDMPRDWDSGSSGSMASQIASVNRMGAGLVRAQTGGERIAVTGRMIYRDGGDLRTPDGRLPDTAIKNVSFGGGVGYRMGNVQSGFSISGMEYDYGLPEEVEDPLEAVEIRMNRLNIQNVSSLELDRFIEYVELRTHYSKYMHDEIESVINPDRSVTEELEISFDQQTLGSSLLLRHKPAGPAEGSIGLSFNYSQLEVGGQEALTPDAENYFIAGYLYEEIGLSRFFSLKTGVRVEFKETFVKSNEFFTDPDEFQDRSDLIFAGALGLNFTPASNWEAGIQVARAFRTPGIEELYSNAPHLAAGSYDIGNPNLENEISIGSDLFINYKSDRISSELSLFTNRINNFIEYSPTGEIHDPSGLPVFDYSSTNALLYGFELQTNLFLAQVLTAGIGFDYVRGKEKTSEQNDLAFMPPFRTHLSATYDRGSWWLGPRLRIVNSQDRVAPNEEPTDGYLLVGLDAGYRFVDGITFSLRVDNLLNESYRDHLSRVEDRNNPMPARNINAMLRWDF